MANYKFPLERPGSQHTCPQCNKAHSFTRYTDGDTGDIVGDDVGICNRSDKCGYHKKPGEFFRENSGTKPPHRRSEKRIPQPPAQTDYHSDEDLLVTSRRPYDGNIFIQYLIRCFGDKKAIEAVDRYMLGTIDSPWKGSVVFWQKDHEGNIRGGKIMSYSPNGHRVDGKINWMHNIHPYGWKPLGALVPGEFILEQCLFGSHLLMNDDKAICIVESEKTAVICSIINPDYTWLATSATNGFNQKKCATIKGLGRTILVYPDRGCYEDWSHKAQLFLQGSDFRTMDLLEKLSGLKEGDDLVDYLELFGTIPIFSNK